jgi:enediyne biosynthesis protein E4
MVNLFLCTFFLTTFNAVAAKKIRSQYVFIGAFAITFFLSCNFSNNNKLFKELPADKTNIHFVNQLHDIDSVSVLEFEYMFNGAGVALIDINNDSLQDIIFAGNIVPCKIYLNKGNFVFEDVTDKSGVKTSGWCYGVAVVDINQDGFQDFYICKAGYRNSPKDAMRNYFYINNGNGTFTDKAKVMGLDDDGYDVHAAFFDYDKDGDLDMYLLKNAFVDYNRNTARAKQINGGAPSNDKLFRHNDDGTFTDVSDTAGIKTEGFGLGVNVCDINNDNWPDIYVSNDFLTNNLVWINNQNGTFTNQAATLLQHTTYNAMGNDVADYNNDGLADVVEVDMLPPDNKRWKLTMMGNTYEQFQQDINFGYEPQYVRNSLQLNNGNGTFSEVGQLAGMHATEWSWAPLLADYDNDGWKDLFVSNGYRQDITNLDFIIYGKRALFMGTPQAKRKQRLDELKKYPGIQVHNYLFKNNKDLTFTDKSKEWGMDAATFSNGAAYGDLDNDGDLDMVINNLDQPASVYQNQAAQINTVQAWLRIGFKGTEKNKNGIGASVIIWQDSVMQHNYFSPYRGYLSTVEPFIHFGIQNKMIDSLRVLWPDGKMEFKKNIQPKQLLWLDYKNAVVDAAIENTTSSIANQFFTNTITALRINYKHQEDNFVDFKVQPLMPHMLSREGPGLATGDVNGDGLEDFFAGAATGCKPAVFLQQTNGAFVSRPMADSNLVDNMGALFFDADNDNDLDLYAAAGGYSIYKNNDPAYTHNLYLNDGKGNFSASPDALPGVITAGSCVTAADYDKDGDLDLFIGGRVSSGEYPYTPKSFLLRNDTKNKQCKLTDVSDKAGTDLSGIGMVSSALWTDFDNDNWIDLIVVGEYMPVRFFKNNKGSFTEVTKETGLQNTNGWWNSITAADFDKDGDMDYIIGNLGLNSPWKASTKEPVCVYASDYDKNGRLDPVMCHYIDGVEQIVHSRDDLNKQMNAMRGRFNNYEQYATASFSKAFREDEIKKAFVLKSEQFANAYLENLGKGKFKMHLLPNEAQFAPMYGALCNDFDGDGNMDVLSVGNSFSTEVQTGRYDAQGSLFMKGDGKGNFLPNRSMLFLKGDNKSIIQLNAFDGTAIILVGTNSDSLKVIKQKVKPNKVIPLLADDCYAIITDKNGGQYRTEFYYGSTYLSQSSRSLSFSGNEKKVTIYNSKGNKRDIQL